MQKGPAQLGMIEAAARPLGLVLAPSAWPLGLALAAALALALSVPGAPATGAVRAGATTPPGATPTATQATPATLAAPPAPAKAAARGPVVVELFTSQGCSSCPPADRLLSRLKRDPRLAGAVIPLAFHVDYWNHLGWSDPFSSQLWSRRQDAYAGAFHSNRIYTPQVVINGRTECVGSDEAQVMRRIREALAAEPAGQVSLGAPVLSAAASGAPAPDARATGASSLTPGAPAVSTSGAPTSGPAAGAAPGGDRARVSVGARLLRPVRGDGVELWVALVESGLTTPVRGGENAKATLHDDQVVRLLVKALTLRPAAGGADAERITEVTLPLEAGWNRSALDVVAFLQDPRSLNIHGAASRPLLAAPAPVGR
jgi:hypothetical protein